MRLNWENWKIKDNIQIFPSFFSREAFCLGLHEQSSEQEGMEVTTKIKIRGRSTGVVQVRPISAREVSLNVLKDMEKPTDHAKERWHNARIARTDINQVHIFLLHFDFVQNVPDCVFIFFDHGSPFLYPQWTKFKGVYRNHFVCPSVCLSVSLCRFVSGP